MTDTSCKAGSDLRSGSAVIDVDPITLFLKTKKLVDHMPSELHLGTVVKPLYYAYEDYQNESGEGDDVCEKEQLIEEISRTTDWLTGPQEVIQFKQPVDQKMFATPLPKAGEELLKMCTPSPFGDLKTGTTVVDTTVRTAYECRPELSREFLEVEVPKLANKISKEMYYDRPVKLVFNKLNVYTEGGFFKPHVDTPKAGNIGTLVIGLTDYYYAEGGLKIGDTTYDLRYGENAVAFYSDLIHEVLPVKKRNRDQDRFRVTATFYIMHGLTEPDGPEPDLSEPTSGSQLASYRSYGYQRFRELVRNYLTTHGPFGFVTRHGYAVDEILAGVLRGVDQMLMAHLKEDFELTVLPILIKHYETDEYEGTTTCEESVYRLSPDDIQQYCVQDQPKYQTNPYSNLLFIRNLSQYDKAVELALEQESMIEHVGNEAQDGYFNGRYWSLGIIINLKP